MLSSVCFTVYQIYIKREKRSFIFIFLSLQQCNHLPVHFLNFISALRYLPLDLSTIFFVGNQTVQKLVLCVLFTPRCFFFFTFLSLLLKSSSSSMVTLFYFSANTATSQLSFSVLYQQKTQQLLNIYYYVPVRLSLTLKQFYGYDKSTQFRGKHLRKKVKCNMFSACKCIKKLLNWHPYVRSN